MTRDQQGVVLFLGLLLTLIFILTSGPLPPPPALPSRDQILHVAGSPASDEVWVEVDGQVRKPGIYPLPKGKSVFDAVEKAGGTAANAALTADSAAVKVTQSGLLRVAGEGEGRVSLHPFDPLKKKVLSIPVNINTANAEELDILPGVGPKMAQAIVEFRKANGKFSALEDLQKVKGLGPKKFAAIRPHITLAD